MSKKTLNEILTGKSKVANVGVTFIEQTNEENFLSYETLYKSALTVLSVLQLHGLRHKDELVLQIEDNKTFITVFWACVLGGIIPVPLTVGKNDEHKTKLFNVWSVLNNPYIVTSKKNLNDLHDFAQHKSLNNTYSKISSNAIFETDVFSSSGIGNVEDINENDVAFIQFSSGSTGIPKGVVLTHRNLIANMQAISSAANYSERDSMISWMPLTHDMGLIGFHINPLFSGMNQYLIPTDLFIRRPAIWFDKVSEHKVNILCSPNFGYHYVMKHCSAVAHDWDLSCVRIIFNGAEPISQKLCDDFINEMFKYGLNRRAMCPVYGLAEASLAVSISKIDDEVLSINLDRNRLSVGDRVIQNAGENSVSFVNVGKPIECCSVRIAGDNDELLANEVIGHIQLKGDNVTSGYYNNPDITRVFFANDGWVYSGDQGFLKDGTLYVTGRTKDVIFVNGRNYYAHDIERIAENAEGIELNKIAVVGFSDNQKEEVIAFVLYRGELESFIPIANRVKAIVNSSSELEVDKIIPVKNIPRTTSGKLQRFKLLERYRNGFYEKVEDGLRKLQEVLAVDSNSLPKNKKEEKILRIWEEVLGLRNINVESKFFEIGGNSLIAAEIVNKVQHEFHVELTTTTLYQFQTIRELAENVTRLSSKRYDPIYPVMRADSYPISSSQKRLYYAWRVAPSSIAYNIPVAIVLKGLVDAGKLEQSLRSMVLHHDALRMTFHANAPRFSIQDNMETSLECMICNKPDWAEKLKDLIRPFDLTQGPLFRFFLLKQEGENESLLFLDFHHIISDGHSVYKFIEDLLDLYEGKQLLNAASYCDFLFWQQNKYGNGIEVADYWLNKFEGGAPVLELPIDFPRQVVLNTEGKRKEFLLDKKTAKELISISRKAAVTNHALFFTLYSVLLFKYSGQEDIVIGVPVSGRSHPDLQQTQGMFVNNLAIRTALAGEVTFIDTVRNTAKILNEAYAHQDISFDDLLSLLNISTDPGRNPMFDTMFMYQDLGMNNLQRKWLNVSKFFFDPGFSKFDISMEIFEQEGDIRYCFEYSAALFKDETILNMSNGFQTIIERVIENPEVTLADLSLLNADEFNNFIVTFNGTSQKYNAHSTVLEQFDDQVKSNPEAIALLCNNEKVTYKELSDKVNQVANSLICKEISKEELIAVLLPKSFNLIITLLGVLKSGAAYLPVDPDIPDERLKNILNDSGCKYVLTEQESRCLNLNRELGILKVEELLRNSQDVDSPIILSNDLAYVIYTSGSSGKPKGVMIEHGSLVNYISWAANQYVGKEPCCFALYSSVAFDLTVTSIFLPLCTGNKLVIYEEDYSQELIEKVIKDGLADVVKLTPSHLRLLCNNNLLSSACKVTRFVVGGENLSSDIANDVHKNMKGEVVIFNEYGPTEATVGCMIYKFDPNDPRGNVPIGQPISNVQIYLLDKYLNPVPSNVIGEIYISGDALARGYQFNEEQTAEKFIANPYVEGTRMYKTGDLAKRLPGGDLEYVGRNDEQVKINGYRVELSEIERVLVDSGYIEQVIVMPTQAENCNIDAYYTSGKSDHDFQELTLREYLADRLPHYMIPKNFIQLEAMPLTKNGKADLDKLRDLRARYNKPDNEDPRNEIEQVSVVIWREILNDEKIGIDDNFFELGGDSIKAVQISSRLFEKGISVKVKDILTYHKIKYISQYAQQIGEKFVYEQGIVEGILKPIPIQRWFLDHEFKNPHYFNQSVLLTIKADAKIFLFEKIFESLIRHHDTLRINLSPDNNYLLYNNEHLNEKFTIQQFEVQDERDLGDICNEIRSSFDISNSLLIKVSVIKVQSISYLFITAHHLVMDGVSWRILLEDFYRAYFSLVKGDDISLRPKTASYQEWSSLLYRLSESKEFEKDNEYWIETEKTDFNIPLDFETKDWSIKNVKKVLVSLDPEQTKFLLKDAHKTYNSDVLILLCVSLIQMLNEWAGLNEYVIELENHGRTLDDLEVSNTIGWFTAMFPVRFVYKSEIGMLIKIVKETLKKVPREGIGYGVEKYLKRDDKQKIQSEIRFNYLGHFGRELNNDLLTYRHIQPGTEISSENHLTTKLEFNAMVIDNKLNLEICYNENAHRNATIDRIAELFMNNLKEVLAYLKNNNEVYFTPSDFEHVDLSEDEIHSLFGD